MNVDVAAAQRLRDYEVDLSGRTYLVAARPAADWIDAVVTGRWSDIVPGWLTTDDDLVDDLDAGRLTLDDCEAVARELCAAVCGVPWWSAVRLIAATGYPDVLGELTLSGVDFTTAPIGVVVAATHRVFTRNMDKAARAKFDAELSRLPAGAAAADVYDEDHAADLFERAAAARGVS